MKIFLYGLIVLAALVTSTPSIVLAETENEGTNENLGKQSTTTQTEGEGNDDNSSSSVNSNLILFVTIAAIASVVGYSSWKVYKIRRRVLSKNLA